MGHESPKISLPEPVTMQDETAAQDDGDRPPASDEVSVLTTHTNAQASEDMFGDRIVPVLGHRDRDFPRNDDAATICSAQSDLNSNAFYWETSPPLIATDYSASLEKTLLRKAPRLLEHINALNVDDPSVILAVKELVCTNEKVSTILKRMHEGVCKKMAANQPTPVSVNVGIEACVDIKFHSNDIQEIARLANKQGYLWKKDELYTYEIPASLEHMRVDFEHAKLSAIHHFFAESVQKADHKYTLLREAFRALVTSSRYKNPPLLEKNDDDDDDMTLSVQPRLPAQWVADHAHEFSLFNVQAFIKDSKIGAG